MDEANAEVKEAIRVQLDELTQRWGLVTQLAKTQNKSLKDALAKSQKVKCKDISNFLFLYYLPIEILHLFLFPNILKNIGSVTCFIDSNNCPYHSFSCLLSS